MKETNQSENLIITEKPKSQNLDNPYIVVSSNFQSQSKIKISKGIFGILVFFILFLSISISPVIVLIILPAIFSILCRRIPICFFEYAAKIVCIFVTDTLPDLIYRIVRFQKLFWSHFKTQLFDIRHGSHMDFSAYQAIDMSFAEQKSLGDFLQTMDSMVVLFQIR